jgi:lipoprotein signal peptidase
VAREARDDSIALSFVLGGALGNILDRSASAMSLTSPTCISASGGHF